jgi:uncharacterized protein (TIGR02687 family)
LVKQQQHCYQDFVLPVVSKGSQKLFVIISDALRYEVGAELQDILNKETRGGVELLPLQGVVPSYTRLGMAALLPHREISIDPSGRVIVDGKDSSSLKGRDEILKSHLAESLAIPLEQLTCLSREEGRELIKPYRIIYLYHNTIDAIGDDRKKEHHIFAAVQTALNEIAQAVKKIIHSLNGTNLLITTDHGFLYNREPLAEWDLLKAERLDAIDGNKRFLIFPSPQECEGLWSCPLDYILKNSLVAALPQGNIRLSGKGGGVNYVHGGAALQEIVLPLIKYHHVEKGKAKGEDLNRPVEVELISTSRRITNNHFSLQFFQTEMISGKLKPRRLKVALYDSQKAAKISNEQMLIADHTGSPEERTFKLNFTLKSGNYDKTSDYYLLLIDEQTGLEYSSIPFQINIAIANDFDDFA